MTDGNTNVVVRLQAFIDAYLEDLQSQSDEELLGGAQEQAANRAHIASIVAAAKREAGKRRLAAARAALDSRAQAQAPLEKIDLGEARRFIAQAANDARITLAARALDEMPDEDVERLYRQLKELGASPLKKD